MVYIFDAKGAIGYVLGSHGGVDHVMVQFEQSVLEEMTTEDKIQIKGYGTGISILMTTKKSLIEGRIDASVNLADYML